MDSLYGNKILRVAAIYREGFLSRLGCINGFTRPYLVLKDFGISQIVEKEDDYYIVNLRGSKYRRMADLDLLKKYVGIEYNQSCKIIDEVDGDTVFYDLGGLK